MGISRITCLMILTNEVQVFDTDQRSEAWLMHEGRKHALLLSCPLDKRAEMEAIIAEIKQADIKHQSTTEPTDGN